MTETRDAAVTACLADNSEVGARMALMLAVSVRNLGGQLSSSPLQIYFASSPGNSVHRQLERLGAEVTSTGPLKRPAAKARLLQDHAERGTGTLVALDAGIVVLGDLACEANPDALRGLPQHSTPLSGEEWEAWLEFRGLPRSSAGRATSGPGRQVPIPYLSSAVLVVPKRFCNDLASSWEAQTQAFTEAFSSAGWNGPGLPESASAFTDELALACAVAETGTPVDPLPPGCNFRPCREYLEISGIGQVGALKAVDCRGGLTEDGFIEPTQFLPLNPDLERLNRMTAAHLGTLYDSRGRNDHAGARPAPDVFITLRSHAGRALRKAAPWFLSAAGRRAEEGL